MSSKLIFVVGETASGKSDYAIKLAQKCNGEVISADSRQVYRGLDIGSGKVSISEMQGVPHHLIDIVDPGESLNLMHFSSLAEAKIVELQQQDKTPVVCGGTGLYIDCLLKGYNFVQNPSKHKLHSQQLKSLTLDQLHTRLPRKVLEDLSKSELSNPRHLSGLIARGTSSLPPRFANYSRPGVEVIYLQWQPDQLRQRINQRLKQRLDQGMVSEVSSLINRGVSQDWLKSLGLEYRYLTLHLEGELSYKAAIDQLENRIWRFTRSQRNWISRWPNKHVIEMSDNKIKVEV